MTAHKAQMKRQDDGVVRLICSGEEDSGEVDMTCVYICTCGCHRKEMLSSMWHTSVPLRWVFGGPVYKKTALKSHVT